ncbi:MAG: hypothetical protein DRP56_08975 [Planctomycetota bacterium]|nr:MAG: hypothetical protein DRP56_08975 [Planctomycetota bacterium]
MVMQSLLATFRNVQGDVFTEATTLALDMSQALGQDLKSSSIMLGKALNDPVVGLTAMSRAGITFSEVQKEQIKQFQKTGDLAAAQGVIMAELSNQFGGQATAAAGTFSGALKQLGNSWGDAKEKMGEYIANIPGFSMGIQMAKTAIENLGLTMKLLWTQAKLNLVSFWEDLKYVFTGQIPTLFSWFLDNWKSLGMDLFNAWKTYMGNLKDLFTAAIMSIVNVWVEGWKAIWEFIKNPAQGIDFSGIFSEIKEGFNNVASEINIYEGISFKTPGPEFQKRTKSAIEEALGIERDKYAGEFAAKLVANMNPAATKGPDAGKTGGSTPPAVAAAKAAGKVGAIESRFLAGSTRGDYQKQTAKAEKKRERQLERLIKIMEEQESEGGNRSSVELRVAKLL